MKRIPEEILTLIAEINEELANINLLRDEIKRAGKKLPEKFDDDKRYIVESLALKLHNFYTTCERIFERISGDINGKIPQGLDWHKRLLKNMTLDIKGVRPPVLSKTTEKELEEYLRFRHLVRNIYGFELEEEKMMSLVERINKVAGLFVKDIDGFISFLETLKDGLK